MRVNLVIQPGDLVEVQLPSGDTLVTGGPEIADLFNPFMPLSPPEIGDWIITSYDIDPWAAMGALGVALQAEARRGTP
jgi:hypothetical protein